MVKSQKTKVMDYLIAAVCGLIIIICLLPVIHVAARSVSSPEALIRKEVLLLPKGLNFDAYVKVLGDSKYIWSLCFTAILTIVCTFVSMCMTIFCAYPFVYKDLRGRKVFNTLIIFTMYFNAGTIPNYLLLKDMGLLENPLVLILPNCLSVFNVIIMKSFFYEIPESLREAAQIEGCGVLRTLWYVYLPLSKPVMETLSLFYAVGRWNGFSDALMFITRRRELFPIQLLLYNLLKNVSSIEAVSEGFTAPGVSESVKAATVMLAMVPILVVYPFLQKYFISGVTLGGVKG